MKKLVSIFFLLLLAVQHAPAINGHSWPAAVCTEMEDDKCADKNKDTKKEKNESKDFEATRQIFISSIVDQIVHNAAENFYLQHPQTSILTPPPDHC